MVEWARWLRSVVDVLYQVLITFMIGDNERMSIMGQDMEKTLS